MLMKSPILFSFFVFVASVGCAQTGNFGSFPKVDMTPASPQFQNGFQPTFPPPGYSPSSQPTNNSFGTTPNGGMYGTQNNRQINQEIYEEFQEQNSINYMLPSLASVPGTEYYYQALSKLVAMGFGKDTFNLRKATFITENAYYENKLKAEDFVKAIKSAGQFLNWKMDELKYNKQSNLSKNLILYRFFTDTLQIKSKQLKHLPFKYDFEDYRGQEDWGKMFVSKVLATNSGQCHSLPMLYLILAREIGAEAQLAYSPSHTYIKFQDDDGIWHNVELTNGMLSTDAFVLQSGFIKAEALQNKIYMQPLNEKQLLSLCFFDLAKGYVRKYGYDEFVENAIEAALLLDSNNINAQMEKSDYLTVRHKYVADQIGANEENFRQMLDAYPIFRMMTRERNRQYQKLDDMGYSEMPADAYEAWLKSMNEAKQKQDSQKTFLILQNKSALKK